jgi:hypothetical protein
MRPRPSSKKWARPSSSSNPAFPAGGSCHRHTPEAAASGRSSEAPRRHPPASAGIHEYTPRWGEQVKKPGGMPPGFFISPPPPKWRVAHKCEHAARQRTGGAGGVAGTGRRPQPRRFAGDRTRERDHRTRERDPRRTSRRDDSSPRMLDIRERLLYVVPQFSGYPVPFSAISLPRPVDVVRPAWIGSLVAVRLLSPYRPFGLVQRVRFHVAAFCVVHPRFSGE